jgi:ferredoxin, 2Fe-2S
VVQASACPNCRKTRRNPSLMDWATRIVEAASHRHHRMALGGDKMGGSNPYIEEVKYKPATKKYKVTFLPSGKTIEVDPERIPYGHNGLPGSILDISEGIKAGLDHACGGVCACSTCHVIVKEGLESCNEATDAELDELDEAPGITPKSRLGCQTVPDGTTDIVVEIPDWNKNYAKEADH